ncbi:NAD(P)-binding protein, partial [Aureobasidium melanogenum]
MSQGLVANGAKVYVTALPTDDIQGAVAELNELGKPAGGTAVGFSSDLSSKEGIAAVTAELEKHETHLDIFCSNAGIRRDPPQMCNVKSASLEELQASMWSSEHSDWDDTFRVNVTAHYFLSVALLKLLVAASELDLGNGRRGRDEGRGVIIITSSCASMHNCTNIDLTSYAASKAAIDHLVPLLASKFAKWYVRVNAINPGFVPSKMNPVEEGNNQFAELFKAMPAARIGKMEDIAGAIIYLSSEAGGDGQAYVDGRCLCVDGGRVLLANGQ